MREAGTRKHVDTVRSLMSAVDAADPFLRGHSYRIAKMCVRVGRELELSNKELEELQYAALLHDIGRTGVSHEILWKREALDGGEQSILRMHPTLGHDILLRMGFFPNAPKIVLAHHERPDGTGYPAGLSGAAIPIGSRIIMTVAAFDAMTSDRPYRRGMAPEAALDELLRNAGSQFFSDVVAVVIDLYSRGLLFEEFEKEFLLREAGDDGNSRALQEYVAKTGLDRTAAEPTADVDRQGAVPVVDVPGGVDLEAMASDIVEAKFALSEDETWRLEVAATSDVGRVRTNNEDSFGLFHDDRTTCASLLVVADGMGGAVAGEIASRVAVEALRRAYYGDEESPGTESVAEAIAL